MKMSSEAIKANMKALKEGRSIVPIQKNGLNIPIFSIDSFSIFEDLSFHLGSNQPFYCFTPVSNGNSLDEDVHEKAAIYLNEIKAIQPKGPYILGAWCRRHFAIFEIAQKLLDQGEKVPLIILIEAYRPIAIGSNNSTGFQIRRAKHHYNQLRGLSVNDRIKHIYGLFDRGLNKLNFLTKKKKSKKRINKTTRPKRNDSELINSYKGNVVVFKSSMPPRAYNNYPDLGWREYVQGDLKIITVEGGHKNILKNPNVIEVASKLSEVLMEYNSK